MLATNGSVPTPTERQLAANLQSVPGWRPRRPVSNHPQKAPTATFVACAFTVTLAFFTPALRADDERSAPPTKSATKAPAETENETLPAWRTDLAACESYLKKLATAARMPTEEDFKKRDEAGDGRERDWTVITDGGGGVIDFSPAEDTVQFRVNEALKGKTVVWEFELGGDAAHYTQVGLTPAGVPEAVTDGEDIPFLTAIYFKRHQAKLPATELRKGQRIVLEGRIGDALKNHDGLESYHGATAIYYLEDIPHPIFFVGLEDVTITRVDPTEEQLAVLLLSDKPNLDREAWKILAVNDRVDSRETRAQRAFDGDVSTVWHSVGKDGQNGNLSSLLVDMGSTQTVTGIRYLPPLDRQRKGTVGKFSLYVSDSSKTMGTPVTTGTFTGYRVEQEVGFEEVSGRYFRFVAHPAADGSAGIAVAELNLLGTAVEIPDIQREPKLPPLADAIERFELLHEKLAEPPAALELTPAQRLKWEKVHDEARSHWYDRHWRPLSDLLNSEQWSAVNRAAARNDISQVEDANFYAAAALPEFSTAAQRAEMAAMSEGMREARVAFLSAIKRTLSASQQAKLKGIVATAAYEPMAAHAEWKDLFDGTSLQGWDGDPKYWTVKDGAITGVITMERPADQNTFLIYVGESKDNTPAEFGDFELKLEYRLVGHNSGIQYRSFKLPGKANRWRVGGYQADFDAAKATVGANYEELGRGVLARRGQATDIDTMDGYRMAKGITPLDDPATLAAQVRDAPEWNELHIIAWGNRLTHYINRVQMSKVLDRHKASRASGLIAIELHAGAPMTVQVRRVRIRTAGSSAAGTPEE